MFKIEGTTITLTRGDTFVCTVGMKRKSTGQAYTPTSGDSIRFAMKRPVMTPTFDGYIDTEPVLEKSIPYDTCRLRIEPNDTKALPFGQYVYDIEITMEDGTVDTFIDTAKFILAPEVD